MKMRSLNIIYFFTSIIQIITDNETTVATEEFLVDSTADFRAKSLMIR
jgi:hypothetical protein